MNGEKNKESSGFFILYEIRRIFYVSPCFPSLISLFIPVKNVTWILVEIPCHFSSQIDGSWVQIYTKSHDYSMSFIQVLCVFHVQTWHGFWTTSSHGIFMTIAKEMMGVPSDLMSFSTKLTSKRHEKIRATFFTGIIVILYYNWSNFNMMNSK